MTEPNVLLIQHVNKRIEEFLDDHDPQDFASIAEMLEAFSRFYADRLGKQRGAA